MADNEKGTCPDCGQEVALKRDGTPRKHDCEPANDPEVMVAPAADVKLDDDDLDHDRVSDEFVDDAEDEVDEEPPEPKRAGGHIDRGDGKGWVLEDAPKPEPKPKPMHKPEPDPATVEREPVVAGGWTLPADPVPGKE